MKTDVSKAGHDCRPLKRKSEVLACPVPPRASGKGLPYAPVDWPNVGDIWGWRVGSRVSVEGFYSHHFLYAPQHLQDKPTRKLLFQSKTSVLHYLKSQFPEADSEAFFASFTWHVPAEAHSSKLSKQFAIVNVQRFFERCVLTLLCGLHSMFLIFFQYNLHGLRTVDDEYIKVSWTLVLLALNHYT